MDRVIVYDGALPQSTDVLNTNMFAMVDSAFQNMATLGTTTCVAGLTVVPSTPTANLNVTVNVGAIFAVDPTDSAAYGDLGTNNATIMKMGILPTAQVLAITPPGTVGFSQVYLVEAILQDIDAGSTVLSYYNSTNPAQPFSGPANSGSSNFTVRTCRCTILLKAGTPATTGTQVNPSTDAGYVPLFYITVAQGQTQITGGNIVQSLLAPYFPTLPQVPYGVLNGTYNFIGTDTGIANAYSVSFAAGQPQPQALVTGMCIEFIAVHANTAGSTVALVTGFGTLGPVTIHRASGIALASGDISAGQIVCLTYDGTFFQMANYIGSGSITNTNTSVNIPYIADTSGTPNVITANFSPAITSGQQVAGLTVEVKLANTITGACVINVSGLGNKSVTLGDLTNPPFNLFTAGMVLLLVYDGTRYQITNTNAGMFYRVPTSNYTFYVNVSTGSDTLYDGTSATVVGGSSSAGPFKTIQKGLNVCWSFAPSSTFNVTLSIAAGTYPENPASPSNPAGNIIINGAGIGSTVISSASSGTTALTLLGPTSVTLQNLTLSGNALSGLVAEDATSVFVTNVAFNNNLVFGSHVWGVYGGQVAIGAGCTIGGNCNSVFLGQSGGSVVFEQVNITISNGISVAAGFCYAVNGGTVSNGTATAVPTFINAGFVSGPKYLATGNGVIWAQTQGFSFFPGSVAGSTQTGGQYIP